MKITLSFDITPDELVKIGLEGEKGDHAPDKLIEALENALKEETARAAD